MHGETTLPVAFAGFVREATLILYTFGRREQAQAAFNIMRARTPGATGVSGLEEFVSVNIDRALKNANRERVVVYTEGFFYQGFLWLAAGDVDKAAASDEMARRHWDSYVSAKPPESLRQLALPALDDVRRHAYGRALIDLPPALAQKLRDAAGEGGQE